jgi:mannose-1-phosphate guanylyltransferase
MYHAVILSGGAGSRLWPMTRQALPKQFLKLTTEQTLIVETFKRLRRTLPAERIWIATGRMHEHLVRDQLPELPPENILGEPIARNTTGGIGLAMARLLRHDPEAVMTVLPSDHLMTNLAQFDAALALAAELAKGDATVTIGVTPTRPETGYGYVERGDVVATGDGVVGFQVKRFVEKPKRETAKEFLRAGTFLWNAGIFTWRAAALRDTFAEHLPAGSVERFEETERLLESDPNAALEAFAGLPNISIDFAVAEKARDIKVVEADLGWIDIGDWSALYSATGSKDGADNVLPDGAVAVDASRSLVWSSTGRVIAAIGVEGLVVVDTPDALLLCHMDRTQDVKKVVDELKARGADRLL